MKHLYYDTFLLMPLSLNRYVCNPKRCKLFGQLMMRTEGNQIEAHRQMMVSEGSNFDTISQNNRVSYES